jgi:hypothetical protein
MRRAITPIRSSDVLSAMYAESAPLHQSRRWFDRYDTKGMRLILVADCHILAWCKNMRSKAVSGLVIVDPVAIVVEHPAGVFLTARFVDDPADLIVFALPEPADPAMVAMRLPKRCVDMAFGIKRNREFIPVLGGAGGKFL